MIDKYLESKKYAWSPTTIKTVRAKLRANAHHLNQPAQEVYEAMKGKYSAYSIKQYFIIFDGYESWRTGRSGTQFKSFLNENSRLFRSAYRKKKVGLSYDEAVKAIGSIKDTDLRRQIHFILKSGVRISESYNAGSEVVGKGNKRRKIFIEAPKKLYPQHVVRRALRRIGLTPHDLRKLCATRLVEKGVSPQDLCEIMGWNSLETAYRYLQPKKDEELRGLMND